MQTSFWNLMAGSHTSGKLEPKGGAPYGNLEETRLKGIMVNACHAFQCKRIPALAFTTHGLGVTGLASECRGNQDWMDGSI